MSRVPEKLKVKRIERYGANIIELENYGYKNQYDAIALAKEKTYLNDKINAIVRSDDVAGEYLCNTISRSLLYSTYI